MKSQRNNWKQKFQQLEIAFLSERSDRMEQKQLNIGLQSAFDGVQEQLRTRSTRSEVAIFMLIMLLGGLGFGVGGGMYLQARSIKTALQAGNIYDGGDYKIQGLVITPEMNANDILFHKHEADFPDKIIGPDGREFVPVAPSSGTRIPFENQIPQDPDTTK